MVIPLFLLGAKKQEIIASGSFCWLVLTVVLHQPRLAPRRMKKKNRPGGSKVIDAGSF